MRHRLVEAGGAWCDARVAFNAAWSLAGRPRDALAMAEAYAQLGAAPWFDGVTILSSSEAGGVATLRTHARTNGIVAEWVVATDARGVALAKWTSVAWGVAPFDAQIEGVTAAPGATHEVQAAPTGALVDATTPVWLLPPIEDPSVAVPLTLMAYGDDGFQIQVWASASGVNPDHGVYAGETHADFMLLTRDLAEQNYNEFLSWGLQKGWTPANKGNIYVDSDTSLTCLACVYIRQDFNIHVSRAVMDALFALGYSYPNATLGYSTVLGHEMMHTFQNAYSKPTGSGNFMDGAWSEGQARFQESLHEYAQVSHQPESLIYAADGNGCNGYGTNYRGGVANGRSYAACLFWFGWYSRYGVTGLVDILEASRDHATKTGWAELAGAIEQGVGESAGVGVAQFALTRLTGRDLAWGSPTGASPAYDWDAYFTDYAATARSAPSTFSAGSISGGGFSAYELTTGATVSFTGTGLELYVVRDDGADATLTAVGNGAAVAAPAAGEQVWIVLVKPGAGSASSTITLA